MNFRKIFIVILIIFGAVACLELLIKVGIFVTGQMTKMKEAQKNASKPPIRIEEKVYPYLSEADFKIKVYSFFRLIQEEKFNEAYSQLDEGFKSDSYPTLDSFVNYSKRKYFSQYGKDFSIRNFNKESANTYTAEVLIEDIEPPKSLPIQSEILTLRFINEKDYRLSLKQFVMAKNMNESVEIKGVIITAVKATFYKDKVIVKVEIQNKNSTPITIASKDQYDIWIGMLNESKNSTKRGLFMEDAYFKRADFLIKPGEKAVFNFPFCLYLSEKPTALFFSNIKLESEVLKTQLFFKDM